VKGSFPLLELAEMEMPRISADESLAPKGVCRSQDEQACFLAKTETNNCRLQCALQRLETLIVLNMAERRTLAIWWVTWFLASDMYMRAEMGRGK